MGFLHFYGFLVFKIFVDVVINRFVTDLINSFKVSFYEQKEKMKNFALDAIAMLFYASEDHIGKAHIRYIQFHSRPMVVKYLGEEQP